MALYQLLVTEPLTGGGKLVEESLRGFYPALDRDVLQQIVKGTASFPARLAEHDREREVERVGGNPANR